MTDDEFKQSEHYITGERFSQLIKDRDKAKKMLQKAVEQRHLTEKILQVARNELNALRNLAPGESMPIRTIH